ncbi:MAG: hypothetical protein M9927_08960 [Anaerolineae bacterium]|nr:hypothetical protein [Anaerolineae bacterium]
MLQIADAEDIVAVGVHVAEVAAKDDAFVLAGVWAVGVGVTVVDAGAGRQAAFGGIVTQRGFALAQKAMVAVATS